MPEGDTRLVVEIVDELGRRLRVPGLAAWLRRVAPTRARGSVSIALVSDARVKALNRRYRRKDAATDVLSFPSGGIGRKGRIGGNRASFRLQPILPIPPILPNLGDIVIARGVAKRQAREAGHAELAELKVLALHGLLHLLGYDHERDDGRMSRVEGRLRRKGGLRAGLIERAAE